MPMTYSMIAAQMQPMRAPTKPKTPMVYPVLTARVCPVRAPPSTLKMQQQQTQRKQEHQDKLRKAKEQRLRWEIMQAQLQLQPAAPQEKIQPISFEDGFNNAPPSAPVCATPEPLSFEEPGFQSNEGPTALLDFDEFDSIMATEDISQTADFWRRDYDTPTPAQSAGNGTSGSDQAFFFTPPFVPATPQTPYFSPANPPPTPPPAS
jgi:hypothetical protein